jgi:hypothetical protein
MKRTVAVLALLVLALGATFGCNSTLSDTDPNNKKNILVGNGGDTSGAGGTSTPGKGLTPGDPVKPPPPPAK